MGFGDQTQAYAVISRSLMNRMHNQQPPGNLKKVFRVRHGYGGTRHKHLSCLNSGGHLAPATRPQPLSSREPPSASRNRATYSLPPSPFLASVPFGSFWASVSLPQSLGEAPASPRTFSDPRVPSSGPVFDLKFPVTLPYGVPGRTMLISIASFRAYTFCTFWLRLL